MGLLLMSLFFGLSPSVCEVVKPRPFVSTVEWAPKNIYLPKGSEIKGMFRLDLFPHAREPLDCFDDPYYREITLQWAARLGKTSIAQVCLAKQAATRPAPMAFSDADQKSVQRVFKRLWQILAKVPALKGKLPPKHLRSADLIELTDLVIHGAWSGSASTAADYAAMVVILNEIDKMSRKKSNEADFAQQMKDRALGFARHKILAMSTPSRKGNSRIETLRLAGDNRRREVPCPFCNAWQVLVEGNGRDAGGLRWKKGRDGHSDPAIALETAWYECRACLRQIRDEHRSAMLQAGVWVKEGQSISGSGRITGTPARPGPHASFGPLSSLYSLLPSMTWGFLSSESVSSRRRDPDGRTDLREKRRRFVNSILGETWDDAPPEVAQHVLAERLCVAGQQLGICPEWVRFLTRGVDCGGMESESGGTVLTEMWYWVMGWGPNGRNCLIDYGVMTPEELAKDLPTKATANLEEKVYRHADGGLPLRPVITLIDSSSFTVEVYQYCRRFRGVFPVKGSSTSAFPQTFYLTGLDMDTAKQAALAEKLGGLVLFMVNGEQTQQWMESVVRGDKKPTDTYGMSLPEQVADDVGLLNQLMAEYPADERTDSGYEVHSWKKRGNNEYRDAARYAFVGAQYKTNHGKKFANLPPRLTQAAIDAQRERERQAAEVQGMTNAAGMPWLPHMR